MELHRTRPIFIKIMFYGSWNLFLFATKRPVRLANILFIDNFLLKMVKLRKLANISYFIANHQMSFFCHQSDAIIAKMAPNHQTWQTWRLSCSARLTAYANFHVTASSEPTSHKTHKKIRLGLSLDLAPDP